MKVNKQNQTQKSAWTRKLILFGFWLVFLRFFRFPISRKFKIFEFFFLHETWIETIGFCFTIVPQEKISSTTNPLCKSMEWINFPSAKFSWLCALKKIDLVQMCFIEFESYDYWKKFVFKRQNPSITLGILLTEQG